MSVSAASLSAAASACAAAVDLEAELNCSVCLSIYRDPVALHCGHNFCWECLDKVWESQATGKSYSCPDCRAEYNQRPELQRNLKLSNIVERFQASRGSPNPLCCDSLPSTGGSQEGGEPMREGHQEENGSLMKVVGLGCLKHGRPWVSYCRQDSVCLCEMCLTSHKGHRMQALDTAVAERKTTLVEEIGRLERAREVLESTAHWLRRTRAELKADRRRLREQVSGLFAEIQALIRAEELGILESIEAEERLQNSSLEARIGETESKQEATDSLLREALELKLEDSCEFLESIQKTLDKLLRADVHVKPCKVHKRQLDRKTVSQAGKQANGFVRALGQQIHGQLAMCQEALVQMEPPSRHSAKTDSSPRNSTDEKDQFACLTLDANTVHCNLSLSEDLRCAEWAEQRLPYPAHPERFRLHPQVLCAQGFTTGRHYWEVEVGGSKKWEVGATCKGPGQAWVDSCISWVLRWDGRQLQAFQGSSRFSSPSLRAVREAPRRLRVKLDCKRGTLSFHTAEEGKALDATDNRLAAAQESGTLLYTFNIEQNGPVYPGFYLEHSMVRLLQT
ncbi:E3 ubiquitin-protein ligase TRIM39-like [Acipenser ruthenus]|uniref:E3 ubiquitin-protein ligase TRIM39-like n=1 Tax=Acipenser ruthenus TaxID=7906 RepID=UPI00274249B0|nr:E3 ubiquitin-protein ligase TRIM39-like [Acipenser ruthenus]